MERFPGSMPVSFLRRHFQTVQSGDYMVSEKTDGKRYLLLICDKGSFFVNRSFEFFRINGDASLLQNFAANGATTLLDGELVLNLHSNEPTYLIFDAICINSEPIHRMGLRERLKAIGSRVVEIYRDCVAKSFAFPFVLIGKVFQEKTLIGDIFASIITDPATKARVFQSAGNKRYHKTDGIIFTPTGPYELYSASQLFKWKQSNALTVDFRVVPSKSVPRMFDLYTHGKHREEDVTQTVYFHEEDLRKMSEAMAKYKDAGIFFTNQEHLHNHNPIVELFYDVDASCWRFYALRPEKDIPNHHKTMTDTMLSAMENITLEELVTRIRIKPREDVWVAEKQNREKAHEREFIQNLRRAAAAHKPSNPPAETKEESSHESSTSSEMGPPPPRK